MRSSIPNIMRAVNSTIWSILPEKLDAMLEFLELRAGGRIFTEEELQARGISAAAPRTAMRTAGQIAVLPLYGCIGQHMGMEMRISGGTSTEAFGRAFDDAMKNPDIGAIVIDCDSPGGSVHGVPELAAKMFKARGNGKKIVAVANSSMNSAAYWICAAADEIVATPSADVGSIGVFCMHTDTTSADEKDGIKRTVIAAGKYKGEAAPGVALTDDAQQALQTRVDEMYAMFAGNVAKSRGTSLSKVKNGYGEGRSIGAQAALEAGMIDRIATLEEVISGLAGSNGASNRMAAMRDTALAALADTVTGDGGVPLARSPIAHLTNAEVRALVTRIFSEDGVEDPALCPDCGEPMDENHVCPPESIPSPDEGPEARGRARDGEPPIPASTRPAPQARSSTMSDKDTAAERAAIETAARSAETMRVSELFTLCAEHNIDAAQRDQWVAQGVSVDAASRQILNIGRERAKTSPSIRVGADREAEKPFASFGEQLVAIVQAGIPGRRVDKRLAHINAQMFAGSPSGMNESVGSEGGFFIQPDLLPGVIDPVYAEDPILSRVTRIPIGSNNNGVKYNVVDETARTTGSRWGGVQMYWAAEADQATATKPKLRQMILDLKKLLGAAYLTDELTQDAPAAQALLSRSFQAETSFMLAAAVYAGTGAGQPLGIKNSGALISQAIESAQTIANSASSLAINTSKMMSRIPASLWGEIIWLYNQELLPYLQVATLGGTSVGAFTPAGGATNKPFDTIWGRPAFASEMCEAVGTPGDIMCIVPSQYHMADKGGPQEAQSVHVRFLYDEMTLRWTYRADGAPVWKTSVTPYKGSNARSPFVALATRS